MSTILGGFGKRSRRGFGSIKVVDDNVITLEYILTLLNFIESSFLVDSSRIVNKKSGADYPWIKEIGIGKSDSVNELLKRIERSSYKYRDPSLGSADQRMASPVYVSIVEIGSEYYPIITTLNSVFPSSYPRYDFSKQNSFKEEING